MTSDEKLALSASLYGGVGFMELIYQTVTWKHYCAGIADIDAAMAEFDCDGVSVVAGGVLSGILWPFWVAYDAIEALAFGAQSRSYGSSDNQYPLPNMFIDHGLHILALVMIALTVYHFRKPIADNYKTLYGVLNTERTKMVSMAAFRIVWLSALGVVIALIITE